MVSEQSSSEEPRENPKRKEVAGRLRNTWDALTLEEKNSRIKKAIRRQKTERLIDPTVSACIRIQHFLLQGRIDAGLELLGVNYQAPVLGGDSCKSQRSHPSGTDSFW